MLKKSFSLKKRLESKLHDGTVSIVSNAELASDVSNAPPETLEAPLETSNAPFASSTTKQALDKVTLNYKERFEVKDTLFHQHVPKRLQSLLEPKLLALLTFLYGTVAPLVDQVIYWEVLVDVVFLSKALVFTWLVGYLRITPLVLPLVCIAVLYALKTSYVRLKSRLKFEAVRQISKTRLVTDSETMEWLNTFLQKFWPMFEPWISAQVVDQVNTVLSDSKPSFVYDIKLTTFTLGAAAPRIESVKTYVNTDDDIVSTDWHLTFTPLTGTKSSNSKIILMTWLGKGMATVAVPVEVSEVAFNGTANIQLTLGEAFPHVRLVDFALRELPLIDFTLKPLKTMDLLNTPLLSQFIIDLINSQLNAFVVAPQKIHIDVETLLAGAEPQKQAIGVLKVTVHEAQALKNMESFGGNSDPYVTVLLAEREVAVTRVFSGTLNPYFNETFYVLVPKTTFFQVGLGSDLVEFIVKDYNKVKKDVFMGMTKPLHLSDYIDHEEILQPAQDAFDTPREHGAVNAETKVVNVQQDEWQPLFGDRTFNAAKWRGKLRTSVTFFPIPEDAFLTQKAFKSVRSSTEAPLSSGTEPSGILRVILLQAKELDSAKSLQGKLNPTALLELNGHRILKTKVKRRTNTPRWSESIDVFISDILNTSVKIIVKDQRELSADPVIGHCTLNVFDLMAGPADQSDWFKLSDVKSGRVRVRFEFAPIHMPIVKANDFAATWFTRELGLLSGYPDDVSSLPLGVLELQLIEAKDLRANDLSTGKSDPYVRVSSNGKRIHRTKIVAENLHPQWHEDIFLVVHSAQDRLELEVLDYNAFSKDICLGKLLFSLSELLTNSVRPAASNSCPSTDAAGDAKMEDILPLNSGADAAEDDGAVENGPPPLVGTEASASPLVKWYDLKDEKKGVVLAEGRGSVQLGTLFFPLAQFTPETTNWATFPCGILRVRCLEVNIGVKTKEKLFVEAFINGKNRVHVTAAKRRSSSVVFDETFECFISDTTTTSLDLRLVDSNSSDGREHGKNAKVRCLATVTLLTEDILSQRLGFDRMAWLPLTEIDGHGKEQDEGAFSEDGGSLANSGEAMSMSRSGNIRTFDNASMVSSALASPLSLDTIDQKNLGPIFGKFGFGFLPVEAGHMATKFQEQGIIELNIIKGINLPAVDRKSLDPYLIVCVNGQKVHRTAIFKRELNPVFDDSLTIPVLSRRKALLEVQLFDYNKYETNKMVGCVKIPLSSVDGFAEGDTQLFDLMHPTSGKAVGGKLELSFEFFSQRVANLDMATLDADDMWEPRYKTNSSTLERVGKVGKAIVKAPTSILTRKRHGNIKQVHDLGKKRFASSGSAQALLDADPDGAKDDRSIPAGGSNMDLETGTRETGAVPEPLQAENVAQVSILKSDSTGETRLQSNSLSQAVANGSDASLKRPDDVSGDGKAASGNSLTTVSNGDFVSAGVFSINIIDLVKSDNSQKWPDCYVTVYDATPDSKFASHGKHGAVSIGKTCVWKHVGNSISAHPIFDEQFAIPVVDAQLSMTKLYFVVKEKNAILSDTTLAHGTLIPWDHLSKVELDENSEFKNTGMSVRQSEMGVEKKLASQLKVDAVAVPLIDVNDKGLGKLGRRLSLRSIKSRDSLAKDFKESTMKETTFASPLATPLALQVSIEFKRAQVDSKEFVELLGNHNRKRSSSIVSMS